MRIFSHSCLSIIRWTLVHNCGQKSPALWTKFDQLQGQDVNDHSTTAEPQRATSSLEAQTYK